MDVLSSYYHIIILGKGVRISIHSISYNMSWSEQSRRREGGKVSRVAPLSPSAAGTCIIATRVEELPRFHSDTSESAATLVSLLPLSSPTTQGYRNQATRTKPPAPQPLSRITATRTGHRIRQPHRVSTSSFSNGGTAMSPDSYRSL